MKNDGAKLHFSNGMTKYLHKKDSKYSNLHKFFS